jgi:hypothetical protein
MTYFVQRIIVQYFIEFLAILTLLAFISYLFTKGAKDGKIGYNIYFKDFAFVAFLVGILLFYIGLIKNVVNPNRSDFIAFLALLALFLFGEGYMFLESILTKGSFNNDSLSYQSLFKREREYKFSTIKSITYNPNLTWYIIEYKDGKKLRLSEYLTGLNRLWKVLKKHNIILKDFP